METSYELFSRRPQIVHPVQRLPIYVNRPLYLSPAIPESHEVYGIKSREGSGLTLTGFCHILYLLQLKTSH